MMRLFVAGLLVAIASNAVAEEKASYFCTAEVSGGIYFDNQTKHWIGATFKAEKRFVLNTTLISERTDYGVLKTIFHVTKTDAGSNDSTPCKESGQVGIDVTSAFREIRCTVGAFNLVFGRDINRFLMIYPEGYVKGEDNNDDTPSVIAGICTKIR
jgi:hypothetical protein